MIPKLNHLSYTPVTGGPYAAFAGRDATRALATFSVNDVKEDYDDLSDLSSMQMDSVREWEMQFTGQCTHLAPSVLPGSLPICSQVFLLAAHSCLQFSWIISHVTFCLFLSISL